MKAYKVEKDLTVTAIDADPDSWMSHDVEWDAVRIDEKHDAWFEASGLFQPGLVTAMIGNTRFRLPVYITGIAGDDIGPVEMTIEEARDLIA